jgi:hypothetical protein
MTGDVRFHAEGIDRETVQDWTQRTRPPGRLVRAALVTTAVIVSVVYVDRFPGTFHLESAADGKTVTDRFIDVSGIVTNHAIRSVDIDANGLHRLAVVNDDGTYTSRVPLVRGENSIQALVGGVASLVTGGSNVVHVTANLPNSDIWSELTWDAAGDVDLHLTLPNGEECFYHNRETGGAVLDVDNTAAYGPEHIVMDKAIPGRYVMSVVYYGTGNGTPPGGGGPIPWHVTLRLRDSATTLQFGGVLHGVGDQQVFWTSDWKQ